MGQNDQNTGENDRTAMILAALMGLTFIGFAAGVIAMVADLV